MPDLPDDHPVHPNIVIFNRQAAENLLLETHANNEHRTRNRRKKTVIPPATLAETVSGSGKRDPRSHDNVDLDGTEIIFWNYH